ncbi:glycosyl hydrolase family 18 protein [Lachnospiraceae bacterium NSJ-143]|nr:glycosyl hydrolase family 18 protein [Lachnospiraceae bacterium NSJ-143]
MVIHTVKPGETLISIGLEYSLSPAYIQNINQLPNPENLVVGQNILILFPKTLHTVRPGDTLYSISLQYSVPIDTLLKNNPNLSANPELYPDEEIVIAFEDEKIKSVITNGYTYGNIPSDMLRMILPYLTFISPFTYGIESDASLIRPNAESTLETASYYRTKPLMHISTITYFGNFSIEAATVVMNTPMLWDKLFENILYEIEEFGYVGIDIDFEFINPSDSLNYAALIKYLRNRLNPYGYVVIAALAPKTSADQKGLLYEGHNYEAVGEAANYAFIMTYEWGYTYGPPMAVAPIESVKRVLDYAVTEIPPEKILMGIPSYGYNWTLPYVQGGPPAQSISNPEAILTALRYGAEIQFDSYSQSPYFYYTDENGSIHEVWFEDAKSSLSKLRLIEMYGLAGCGYWNLERPFPQNYMVLNSLYYISEYSFNP